MVMINNAIDPLYTGWGVGNPCYSYNLDVKARVLNFDMNMVGLDLNGNLESGDPSTDPLFYTFSAPVIFSPYDVNTSKGFSLLQSITTFSVSDPVVGHTSLVMAVFAIPLTSIPTVLPPSPIGPISYGATHSYIEFEWTPTTAGSNSFQFSNVTGYFGFINCTVTVTA